MPSFFVKKKMGKPIYETQDLDIYLNMSWITDLIKLKQQLLNNELQPEDSTLYMYQAGVEIAETIQAIGPNKYFKRWADPNVDLDETAEEIADVVLYSMLALNCLTDHPDEVLSRAIVKKLKKNLDRQDHMNK